MKLYEWTKHYIKFKDQFKKEIIEIELKNKNILVKEKKETKEFIVMEKLDNLNAELKNIKKEKTIIVCLNNKKNVEIVYNNWNEIIKYPQLTLIFVQPTNNEKWLIHPATHNKIAEKIKDSLKILYESISSIE